MHNAYLFVLIQELLFGYTQDKKFNNYFIMKIVICYCMCLSTMLDLTFLTVFSKFGEAVASYPQSGTIYYRTENMSVENWVDIASFKNVASKIGKLKKN